jgi:hypothetical protein
MSSPKILSFFLYDSTTGVPLTGAVPTFTSYRDTDGASITQPSIAEIGGGAYKFTPVFPTDKGIVFSIYSGSVATIPEYQSGFLRPEDYNVDYLIDIYDEHFGKWEIKTSGVDANRLILYRVDGVTVLKKFDLYDSLGFPGVNNPFKRDPV